MIAAEWRLRVCVCACVSSGRASAPSKEHGNERNGTRLLVVIGSVPMQKNAFGSMQNPGPRQSNQYERYVLHMPRHQHAVVRKLVSTSIFGGVHLHQTRCCLFPFGRAVRSSQRRRSASLIPRSIYCFSRAALNLFVFHNQSAPIHVADNIPFDSFQCSPEWVQTRRHLPG